MPTYFFHLRDGEDIILDPDGRDLSSIDAVVAATLNDARGIISHDAQAGQIKLAYRLDVEDEDGHLVHRLDFEDAVVLIRRQPERLKPG